MLPSFFSTEVMPTTIYSRTLSPPSPYQGAGRLLSGLSQQRLTATLARSANRRSTARRLIGLPQHLGHEPYNRTLIPNGMLKVLGVDSRAKQQIRLDTLIGGR